MGGQGRSSARPRGRRPAGADTRGAILAAARGLFSTQGYAAVSLRAVAREAEVDPALVHHYFSSKTELFVAAMESPVNPAERVAQAVVGPVEQLGERIVRTVLLAWDPPEARDRLRVMLRGVMEHPDGLRAFREFLVSAVLEQIADSLSEVEPVGSQGSVSVQRRTSLVGSQLAGLLMARYVLALPDVAEADVEELVSQVGPTVQRYLTGEL